MHHTVTDMWSLAIIMFELGAYDISMVELFKYPTVNALAEFLADGGQRPVGSTQPHSGREAEGGYRSAAAIDENSRALARSTTTMQSDKVNRIYLIGRREHASGAIASSHGAWHRTMSDCSRLGQPKVHSGKWNSNQTC
jgi:hypothetical protein